MNNQIKKNKNFIHNVKSSVHKPIRSFVNAKRKIHAESIFEVQRLVKKMFIYTQKKEEIKLFSFSHLKPKNFSSSFHIYPLDRKHEISISIDPASARKSN